MVLIYNIGISFYTLAIRVVALFSPKAKLFIQGRKKLISNLKKDFKNNNSPVAWFHCASLGEFEQARPLIEEFKKDFSSYKILLTFFSPSGYEIRKNYALADWVYYIPVDKHYKTRAFIDTVNPSVGFIIKYEFWYHLLKAAHKKNIPLISVSSVFRADHVFSKWYGNIFKKILHYFTYFFVQDDKSLSILKKWGFHNSTKAGDTRFDRVLNIKKNVNEIPIARSFSGNNKTFVVGSCWQQDMEVLLPFINDKADYKFIIAPHNIDSKFIQKLEHEINRKTILFSNATIENAKDYDVLIIDNVGMLSSLYQYGNYAWVGGAFGHGLHNILEAATYGIPVFFGNKNYTKFHEAVELINLGGAFAVKDYGDFINNFDRLENNQELYLMISDINADYINSNTGATQKILKYCKNQLDL